MATTKKWVSYERLQNYDTKIKAEIADGDTSTLNSAKKYADDKLATLTRGSTTVAKATEATHATSADTATTATTAINATNATKAEEANHAKSADNATNATHATSADTATTAISATNATNATNATKATQDASGNVITTTYETKADASAKLTEAKNYADTQIATAVDGIMGEGAKEALDTIGELSAALTDNQDMISTLNSAITSKADKEHTHSWDDIGTVIVYESDNGINGIENITDIMLIEGEIYTVVCNGITYECLARTDSYSNVYIGNQDVPDDWEFPETIESDEPFFFATYSYDNWSMINVIDDSINSICITGPAKIDPKYIPAAELVQPDWNQNDETANDYVKNRTHYKTYDMIVQWDGDISKASDQTVYSFSDSATPFRYYLITPYEEIGLSTRDLENAYYVYGLVYETTDGLSCTDDYIVKGLIWEQVPGFVYTVKDNVTVNGVTFGRAGLYLARSLTGGNVSEVGVVHYKKLAEEYLPDHTHEDLSTAISTNTAAITANTNSITSHTTAISNLQTAVGEFEEITSDEITALFA